LFGFFCACKKAASDMMQVKKDLCLKRMGLFSDEGFLRIRYFETLRGLGFAVVHHQSDKLQSLGMLFFQN